MSVTKLTMELRNLNFGAVVGGNFWKAQVEGMRHFWIGDTLFLPPRSVQGTEQFGYEETVPVIKVHYTDGSIQTFGDVINRGRWERTLPNQTFYNGFIFPQPGQSSDVELTLSKSQGEVQQITLELMTGSYGHSNSGGGGFSSVSNIMLGSATIAAKSLSERLIVRIKLGEIWDTSVSESDLDSSDFLKIDFMTRPSFCSAWRDVPVHPHWRSALNAAVTTAPLHGTGSRIPIAAFDPKQQGEVISINHANEFDRCGTKLQRAHNAAYERYQEERKKLAASAAQAAASGPLTYLAKAKADADRVTAAPSSAGVTASLSTDGTAVLTAPR